MAMYIENPQLEEELDGRDRRGMLTSTTKSGKGSILCRRWQTTITRIWFSNSRASCGKAISKRGLGKVRPGVNLAASTDNWKDDYRVPDVVVFLAGTAAENHDALLDRCGRSSSRSRVRVTARTRKLPFYSRIGVRELLIFNRQSWALELYRHQAGNLEKVGESTLEQPAVLASEKVPLEFWLIPGEQRPRVAVRDTTNGVRSTV